MSRRRGQRPTTRRRLLRGAAGFVAGSAAFSATSARSAPVPPDVAALLDARFGRRDAHDTAPDIDIARVVENGNSVAIEAQRTHGDAGGALHLMLPRNPEPWALTARFGRDALPHCATRVRLSSTQNAVAIDERADGRLARTEVPVLVTLGACIDENFEDWVRVAPGRPQTARDLAEVAARDADDATPGAGFTGVRLGVPDQIIAGETAEVRMLLRHPMETGYRIDTRGARVPRNLVEHLRLTFDGEPVAELDIGPAVAADPYFAFRFRPRRSGQLVLECAEDRGASLRESREIEVHDA